ncbi:MAG: hypothetical protein AB7V58_09075 [Solirubrobacterales bacterium]
MASVETTTIRVRRATKERLQVEAESRGKSVTELLEMAADVLYEQRILEGAVRSWEKHGPAMREEMKDWLEMPGPPLPDDDWSDLDSPDE